MNYGSICSGIEAVTVAWHPLGWKAQFYAEIDPFCCALLKEKYPEVPNYGDFTKIQSGSIDLLVGGTPCQSFSVAGQRKGLDDPRGNLTLEYFALAGRLRPKWLVWENVPGVMSDDGGRTFGTILGIMGKLGYGFAYRILDAQYFGVAQRRRRVFIVGYLGNWRYPSAVLFESDCLSGNSTPSRKERKDVAGTTSYCAEISTVDARNNVDRGDSQHLDRLIASTVVSNGDAHSGFRDENGLIISNQLLTRSGGNQVEDTYIPVCFKTNQSAQSRSLGLQEEQSPTLGSSPGGNLVPGVMQSMAVRRLMPIECERLQGFPDNYTAITYRGKPAADGPRYKAIGNSMAVPVMRWIGQRIQAVEDGTT